MGQVNGKVASVLNGVSQQDNKVRLSSQAEEQINRYSTPARGNRERPHTNHVARIENDAVRDYFRHTSSRDSSERYSVSVGDGIIKVINLEDGSVIFPAHPDGLTYLDIAGDPRTSFKALSVADYTFIVNTEKTVAMASSPVSDPLETSALVSVLGSGSKKRAYKIFLDDTLVAHYEWDGDEVVSSEQLAGWLTDDGTTLPAVGGTFSMVATISLADSLDPAEWTVTRTGNVIHILNIVGGGTDFSIRAEDGNAGNTLSIAKGRIQRFDLLPDTAPEGFKVEVVSDPTEDFDNYWVEFQKLNPDDSNGIWKEVIAPDTKLELDATTMPHILVRESDGSFTFKKADWTQREVGDDETNPDPSFVGRTIADIHFHKNRLFLFADESAIGSATADHFRFFKETTTALLDDDPIDVSITDKQVQIIKHAQVFDGELYVFSERGQFTLTGGDLLTPKTAAFDPVTSFESAAIVRPVTAGDRMFFVDNNKIGSSLYDYHIDSDTLKSTADDVTQHVPSYIPTGTFKIVASGGNRNAVFLATDGDPEGIYVYQYFWSGNQRIQSAIHKWTFQDGVVVKDLAEVDGDLYLFIERNSEGLYLERLVLDPDWDDFTDTKLTVYMDRRTELDGDTGTYTLATNRTRYTIPYAPDAAIAAVTSGDAAGDFKGFPLEVLEVGADWVDVKGDTTDHASVYFGLSFESVYEFSPLLVRKPTRDGGESVEDGGVLRLSHAVLQYADTAYLNIEVTPYGRTARNFAFEGRPDFTREFLLDNVSISNGKKRFPCKGRADLMRIRVTNATHYPSTITGLRYWGTWTANGTKSV